MKTIIETPLKQEFSINQVSCSVKKNEPVNEDYRHLILNAPEQVLEIKPGQFFQILCPKNGQLQPYFRRPMSIYGADIEKGELHFLYKVQGEGTLAMSTLEEGDDLNVLGPLGNGFNLASSYKNIVLVARGVGLATLAPLAELAEKKQCKVTAICSARSPEFLMSIDYFKSKGVEVITLTDTEGTSVMDNLESILMDFIKRGAVDCFFTCGSQRVQKLLQKLSVDFAIPGQVALEQQMACGIGMCFCCVRPFHQDGEIVSKRVCNEGPVFNLEEVIYE